MLRAVFAILLVSCTPVSVHAESPADGAVATHARIKLVDTVQLSASRSGLLVAVPSPGTVFRANEVVVELDNRIPTLRWRSAEREANDDVDVRFARKAGELAQLKYERALAANTQASFTVPELEIRELRIEAERALLQLERAQRDLKLAELRRDELREDLAGYQIVAPFSGQVREVFKRRGEVVREGDPVLELVGTSRVRAEFHLPAQQLTAIRVGARVEFQLDSSYRDQRRYSGIVQYVDVKIEPVSGHVSMWAAIDNADGLLRDGHTGSIRVIHGRPGTASGSSRRAVPGVSALRNAR